MIIFNIIILSGSNGLSAYIRPYLHVLYSKQRSAYIHKTEKNTFVPCLSSHSLAPSHGLMLGLCTW